MSFTEPLWEQGAQEVMTQDQVERERRMLLEIEELVPLESVKAIVSSLNEAAISAAAGEPLLEELDLPESLREAARKEFESIRQQVSRPDTQSTADLVREQFVRYWVKVLLEANQRWPLVHLGTALLPTREGSDAEVWNKLLSRRALDLRSYLSLSAGAFEGLTRLFVGAVQSRLLQESIDLPRGLRVSLRPNQEVIVQKVSAGVVPASQRQPADLR